MRKVNINRSIQPNQCKRGSITLPLFFSSLYVQKKKHQVSSSRLSDLKRTGNIYIISCITHDCPCQENTNQKCRRGFFSLLLQALYGIRFSLRYHLPYYINYGNGQYAYSDPEKFDGDLNFWNYYFEQPLHKPDIQSAKATTVNLHYETFPLRIWHKHFLKELSSIYDKHVALKEEVKATLDQKLQIFRQQKILGVHIRGSDHYTEIEPVPIRKFFRLIHKKSPAFDKIFLATDDENILSAFLSEFGEEDMLYHPAIRSTGKVATHTTSNFQNRYQLGLEALTDCYSLAHCSEAILVHSNLSYTALVLNPPLPYTLMETRKSATKRIKTKLLYTLDRWGIRNL